MTEFTYVGSELDLFAAAVRWKAYWSGMLRPFIQGDVLEVGAGCGSNTPFLDSGGNGRWVCLEPDAALLERCAETAADRRRTPGYEFVQGTVQSFTPEEQFDAIVYIDVLEHIEDDRAELEEAALRLRPGGRIVVLSPAHQRLYTPFDRAIGHYRRYNRAMLRAVTPETLRVERLIYLDAAGMLASAANLLFLKQSMPRAEQLQVWDHYLVPASRVIDKLTGYRIGKSIAAVWSKPQGTASGQKHEPS